MHIITVAGQEKDGAYSVVDDDGEEVLRSHVPAHVVLLATGVDVDAWTVGGLVE